MQARAATAHEGGATVLVGRGVHWPPVAIESGMIIELVPASHSDCAVLRVHTPGKNVFCAQAPPLGQVKPA
jgi:hypothetical protein